MAGVSMLNNIGLHVIGGSPCALANGNAKPAIVKLVDPSIEYVREVRVIVGPDCLLVIRWTEADQNLDNPAVRAGNWFNKHLPFINAVKGANVLFEGLNEIADTNAANFATYELTRGHLLHGVGANCGYLSTSVGAPDLPVWATYQPVLNDMRPGDYVCLHEYWSDTADIDNRWHCGRWTRVPQLALMPIAVTECGRDYLEDTKKGKPGYKLTCSDDVMVGDIRKYSALMAQYPNVKGATVFQVGSSDPQWAAFDVSSLWRRVVAEYTAASVTPPAQVVIQEPPMTIVGRCFDEQGVRHYLQEVDYSNWKPTSIWLHHTAVPTLNDWKGYETILAMKAYYDKQEWTDAQGRKHIGWGSGPHFFVAPEGIWAFTPPNEEGSHVYGFNAHSIGIEMVGNYQNNRPSGDVLEYTIWLLMVCCKQFFVAPEAIHFHRDANATYPAMATDCPGKAVTKEWLLPKVRTIYLMWDGMPEDEGKLPLAQRLVKVRTWNEEATRWNEQGYPRRVHDLLTSGTGWMYEQEGM
jgi:hypothetical protein